MVDWFVRSMKSLARKSHCICGRPDQLVSDNLAHVFSKYFFKLTIMFQKVFLNPQAERFFKKNPFAHSITSLGYVVIEV